MGPARIDQLVIDHQVLNVDELACGGAVCPLGVAVAPRFSLAEPLSEKLFLSLSKHERIAHAQRWSAL